MYKKTFSLIALVLVLATMLIAPINASSSGFRTGYQGLEIEFNSLKWNDHWYDAQSRVNPNYQELIVPRHGSFLYYTDVKASAYQFGDRLNFDADLTNDGLPNIMASQSVVSVDQSIPPEVIGLWRIFDHEEVIPKTNATGTYNVTVTTYKEFQILKYICRWQLNEWMTASHMETFPYPYPLTLNHYYDVQIKLKITPKPFVYFLDNPVSPPVFAPVYMALEDNPTWAYYDSAGIKHLDNEIEDYESVYPGSKGETVSFYYNEDGSEVNLDEDTVLSYDGFDLDPAIFRTEYWSHIGLDKWIPWSVKGPWQTDWFEKLPSVQLNFIIHVLVIGEWLVQLSSEEAISLEPHPTAWQEAPIAIWQPLNKLSNWLQELHPITQSIIKAIALIIIGLFIWKVVSILNLRFKRGERKGDRTNW